MPNKTATELSSQDRNEEYLNASIAEFIKNYRPADPRDAAHFEIDLISLIRRAYSEAAKPYQRTMEQLHQNIAVALPIINKITP